MQRSCGFALLSNYTFGEQLQKEKPSKRKLLITISIISKVNVILDTTTIFGE
jgi:hypothetical protein